MLMLRAKKLPDISPASWEHPADKAALSILTQTRGIDELVKMLVGGTTERSIRLLHVASTVKVTQTQFTKVKNLLDRVLDILDWPVAPDVFIANNPFYNAGVYGVREPFIVINSSLLKAMDDDELYCVIAHEVGHIMSGHSTYKTVLWMLLKLSVGALPIAGLLVKPLIMALREWDRKSELSADRAALLALQGETPNYNVLMKMAGGADLTQMNVNDFFLQAYEYEEQKDLLDGLAKLMNTIGESHPFPVIRLQELRSWAASGQYQAILDGKYARRSAAQRDPKEDVREGYDYYKGAVRQSDDPLVKTVKNVGDTIGKTAEGIRDALKDKFRNR